MSGLGNRPSAKTTTQVPECLRFGARLDEGTRQSIAHGQRIRAREFHRLRQSGDEELFDVIAGFDAMTPQAVQRR